MLYLFDALILLQLSLGILQLLLKVPDDLLEAELSLIQLLFVLYLLRSYSEFHS